MSGQHLRQSKLNMSSLQKQCILNTSALKRALFSECGSTLKEVSKSIMIDICFKQVRVL